MWARRGGNRRGSLEGLPRGLRRKEAEGEGGPEQKDTISTSSLTQIQQRVNERTLLMLETPKTKIKIFQR